MASKKRKIQKSSKVKPRAHHRRKNIDKNNSFERNYMDYIKELKPFGQLKVHEKSAVIHIFINEFVSNHITEKKCKCDKEAPFCMHFKDAFTKNFTWSHVRETVSIFGQQNKGNNGNIGEEWRLYFTPHNTSIKELYLVVKPSLIPGAGLGLFTALPLCNNQTIGIMTGTLVAQSSQGASSVDIDTPVAQSSQGASSVEFDFFSSKFGTYEADRIVDGTSNNPFFGMGLANSASFSRDKPQGRARKNHAVIYKDLVVTTTMARNSKQEILINYKN